jgi:3-hydroxyacyl-CoA dehydrogenase/enoyl-CoA hydratase/3-hydroxybutyryl-CoA epimerase
MVLLLTGNSLDADSAVAAGLFDAKVAADKLLPAAQARARELQGQPYDAVRKFRYLAQSDVPDHSDSAARQVALDQGVADADLDIYPAYLAITHSVLLGARLPLHQATDVEMRQFLKLMFNPVAGNMIGTLTVDKKRADHVARNRVEHDRHAFYQPSACRQSLATARGVAHNAGGRGRAV